MVLQFIAYFSVAGSRNYGSVRAITRFSRSPMFTVFATIVLYPVIFFWLLDFIPDFLAAMAP